MQRGTGYRTRVPQQPRKTRMDGTDRWQVAVALLMLAVCAMMLGAYC